MTTASAAWAHKVQGDTLELATEHNEPWSREDLELVVEMTGEVTDQELALATGRTLYALWAIQHRIAVGDVNVGARRVVMKGAQPVVRATCGGCWQVKSAADTCGCDD